MRVASLTPSCNCKISAKRPGSSLNLKKALGESRVKGKGEGEYGNFSQKFKIVRSLCLDCLISRNIKNIIPYHNQSTSYHNHSFNQSFLQSFLINILSESISYLIIPFHNQSISCHIIIID